MSWINTCSAIAGVAHKNVVRDFLDECLVNKPVSSKSQPTTSGNVYISLSVWRQRGNETTICVSLALGKKLLGLLSGR